MSYKFENLEIWKQARVFAGKVYRVVETFPKFEEFGLSSQLRRAAVSIALNIAEGCDKGSDQEFVRFLRISLGSLNETVTGLYLAKDLGYLKDEDFQELYEETLRLTKQIKALIKSLRSKDAKV